MELDIMDTKINQEVRTINSIFAGYGIHSKTPCVHPIIQVIGTEWQSAAIEDRYPDWFILTTEYITTLCEYVSSENPDWHLKLSSLDLNSYLDGLHPSKMWWLEENTIPQMPSEYTFVGPPWPMLHPNATLLHMRCEERNGIHRAIREKHPKLVPHQNPPVPCVEVEQASPPRPTQRQCTDAGDIVAYGNINTIDGSGVPRKLQGTPSVDALERKVESLTSKLGDVTQTVDQQVPTLPTALSIAPRDLANVRTRRKVFPEIANYRMRRSTSSVTRTVRVTVPERTRSTPTLGTIDTASHQQHLRTETVAAGRGETRPNKTTICTHDALCVDERYSGPDHTMDNLRQLVYIEPVNGHDVECTTDKPEPPSFINEEGNSTLLNHAKYDANERSMEQISRTQTAHETSTKRLNDTKVEANEPHTRRLEHMDTELRGNCERTRTTERRTLCHEKGRRNPEIDYRSPQKESAILKQPTMLVNEPIGTPPRNHDGWIGGCQQKERYDNDTKKQCTDARKSRNASSMTKDHLPRTNPERTPTGDRQPNEQDWQRHDPWKELHEL
ncbi:hypothetical protein H4582DRAFT_2064949 [Lactarius indigo]|nr:hypothetical protein H4582DRAFT_2064949 [Lactarius indigo]